MSGAPPLEVFEVGATHALGRWQSVMLYVWRGATTLHGAKLAEQSLRKTRAVEPGGPGVLLGVVEAGSPPPEAEVRKALAAVLAAGSGFVQASAVVFEGSGFQASMVRGVATALAWLAKPDYPHKVFHEVAPATDWIESQLRGKGHGRYTAAELQSVLRDLRSRPRDTP